MTGMLFLSVDGRDETVDFFNSQGALNVEADRDEVYDVEPPHVGVRRRSAAPEVSYTTYFLSNALAVRHGGALLSFIPYRRGLR